MSETIRNLASFGRHFAFGVLLAVVGGGVGVLLARWWIAL